MADVVERDHEVQMARSILINLQNTPNKITRNAKKHSMNTKD